MRKLFLLLLMAVLLCIPAWAGASWYCAVCHVTNEYSVCSSCGQRNTGEWDIATCASCKTTIEIRAGYRYCPSCGAALSANVSSSIPIMTETPKPTATPKRATPAPKATAAPKRTSPAWAQAAKSTPKPLVITRPRCEQFRIYDESTRVYYHQMSEKEKQLFSVLYEGIMDFETRIDVSGGGYTAEMFHRVRYALLYDSPELFHLNAKMPYTLNGSRLKYVEPSYRLTKQEYDANWRQMEAIIRRFQDVPGFGDTDYSKQFTIYSYIIQNCEYVNDSEEAARADALYVTKKAQCMGYTMGLNLALRYYGIQCTAVSADVPSGGGHCWTIAKIDGSWYHCDVTWDDPSGNRELFPTNGNAYLKLLNITDELMYEKRIPRDMKFTQPACTSIAANYIWREGIYVFAGERDVIALVKKELDAFGKRGYRYVGIQFEEIDDYYSVLNQMGSITGNLKKKGKYSWSHLDTEHYIYVALP